MTVPPSGISYRWHQVDLVERVRKASTLPCPSACDGEIQKNEAPMSVVDKVRIIETSVVQNMRLSVAVIDSILYLGPAKFVLVGTEQESQPKIGRDRWN